MTNLMTHSRNLPEIKAKVGKTEPREKRAQFLRASFEHLDPAIPKTLPFVFSVNSAKHFIA